MSDDEDEDDKTLIVAPGTAYQMAVSPHSRLKCTNSSLLGLGPGAEILLDVEEVTIGRGTDNSVSLQADGVSRKHARIYAAEQEWWLEDQGSTNGVRVNSQQIERIALQHGDSVEIGSVPFIFTVDSKEPKQEAVTRMEFVTQPAANTDHEPTTKRPEATAGKSVAPTRSNTLLWIVVLAGAGVIAFAIYSVLMQ